MTTPRWQQAIQKALTSHEKSVVIQLASIDPASPIPYVRSLIMREFLSPAAHPNFPLLLTTTDVRTPKTAQIISHPAVHIAWWIEGTQEQFRVAGRASVIPAPSDSLYRHFMYNTRGAGAEVFRRLEAERFDWEAKRRAVFEGLSPRMKATWCRPVPGSRLEGGEEEARKWPETVGKEGEGGEEERRNWEVALSNFGLLVVDPSEVDYVEVGVFPNRRTKFWRGPNGWEEEAVVP